MNGKICAAPPTDTDRAEAKAYSIINPISVVSSRAVTKVPAANGKSQRRVALLDFGAKRGIAAALAARGCEVWIFPCDTPAQEILKAQPQGVMLSNGPGDPADPGNAGIVETIRALDKSGITIFGICMGHQLLACAKGYSTRKLKFGHRGANQPVKDTRTGQVFITSQNHGYEVVADDSAFINVNDGSCEGLDFGNSFSAQFHPEARGGPLDTSFLFDRFMERMAANAS
jgi:carbamoyl-phosphate synthase small subunit